LDTSTTHGLGRKVVSVLFLVGEGCLASARCLCHIISICF